MPQENVNSGTSRRGRSGMREAMPTLTPEKLSKRPPSLNGINKQLP